MNTKLDRLSLEDEIRTIARSHKEPETIPASVYRIELNPQVNFRSASKIIDYLSDLGVNALYCSPYFQTVAGSQNNYNITDATRLNAALGSEQDYENFCGALKAKGMGQILDVVPNHMGIQGGSNNLWMDVLENGPSSLNAYFFDIDWTPKKQELRDKVLIPVLGAQYGTILEAQEIKLSYDNGTFSIHYWDSVFPVDPQTYPIILEFGIESLKASLDEQDETYLELLSVITGLRNLPPRTVRDVVMMHERAREKEIAKSRLAALLDRSEVLRVYVDQRVALFNGIKGDAASFDSLDRLLNEQAYRLSYWRVAAEEINYRRFFDVNELAAIRMEDRRVFDHHHELVLRLLAEGKLSGLRIDHPDGLYDPPAYFRNLQHARLCQKVEEALEKRGAVVDEETRVNIRSVLLEPEFLDYKPLYVVVEKILDRKELLPDGWSVHGTVGYGYLNNMNGLFVSPDAEKTLSDFYEKFSGQSIDLEELIYERKKYFAAFYMASEINMLAHQLNSLSEKNRRYRDFTLNNLTTALREVIACFPVYRTYIEPLSREVTESDQKYIHIAIEKAKSKHPALSPTILDFIKRILSLQTEDEFGVDRKWVREFIMRFQQLSSPIMAKGVEDTAFYIYNRLLSLNEVGGDPSRFSVSSAEFHKANQDKSRKWPYGFLTGSTHDTKRSEDARMRLNVLSELPEEWKKHVERWTRLNKKHKTLVKGRLAPDRNTEYLLYQTLIAVWPDYPLEQDYQTVFYDRITSYLEKAVREAKVNTNWWNPHAGYEQAVRDFIMNILKATKKNLFLESFKLFQGRTASLGMFNSLSALTLKLGSPGVVDTYQGTELWDYTLVDPDNRRNVDFDLRRHLMSRVKKIVALNVGRGSQVRELLRNRIDSLIKLYLLLQGLDARNRRNDLFLRGDYIPLPVEGAQQEHVVAFLRSYEDEVALVAAGRFFGSLDFKEDELPVGKRVWTDTRIVLPKDVKKETFIDYYTGHKLNVCHSEEKLSVSVDELFKFQAVAIALGEES